MQEGEAVSRAESETNGAERTEITIKKETAAGWKAFCFGLFGQQQVLVKHMETHFFKSLAEGHHDVGERYTFGVFFYKKKSQQVVGLEVSPSAKRLEKPKERSSEEVFNAV